MNSIPDIYIYNALGLHVRKCRCRCEERLRCYMFDLAAVISQAVAVNLEAQQSEYYDISHVPDHKPLAVSFTHTTKLYRDHRKMRVHSGNLVQASAMHNHQKGLPCTYECKRHTTHQILSSHQAH